MPELPVTYNIDCSGNSRDIDITLEHTLMNENPVAVALLGYAGNVGSNTNGTVYRLIYQIGGTDIFQNAREIYMEDTGASTWVLRQKHPAGILVLPAATDTQVSLEPVWHPIRVGAIHRDSSVRIRLEDTNGNVVGNDAGVDSPEYLVLRFAFKF